MTSQPVDVVISVASKPTLDVWRITAPHLVERVESSQFALVVPRRYLRDFVRVSPSEVTITPEEDYDGLYRPRLQVATGEHHSDRFGWYLQQFLKIDLAQRFARSTIRNESDQRIVLWDADTVPLRPLSFFSSQGKPVFYRSSERHGPYFNVISRLLGITEFAPHSFVAQSLPIRGSWIREFIDVVERRHGVEWFHALIQNIQFASRSGFSEYETLGNFFFDRFPGGLEWQETTWERNGWKMYNDLLMFESDESPEEVDFVAFEQWHRQQGKRLSMTRRTARALKVSSQRLRRAFRSGGGC